MAKSSLHSLLSAGDPALLVEDSQELSLLGAGNPRLSHLPLIVSIVRLIDLNASFLLP